MTEGDTDCRDVGLGSPTDDIATWLSRRLAAYDRGDPSPGAAAGTVDRLRGLALQSVVAALERPHSGMTILAKVRLYQDWIDANSGHPLLFAGWFNLGVALGGEAAYERAATAYRHALALNPGFLPAVTNLAAVLEARAREVSAMQQFRAASPRSARGPAAPRAAEGHGTSLLIEGWRGLNHSYSLVNQYQILELMKLPGLRLFHHDLPAFRDHWNRADNNAGFAADAQGAIDALPPAGDTGIDCVYRIACPALAGADDDTRRTLTFMVTELGLSERTVATQPDGCQFFVRDENLIVTPSRWSHGRLVDFGFPADKVRIVPHGVDSSIFRPLAADERRAARASLGIGDGTTVFANVGGSFLLKGSDLLLRAFAELHARGRDVCLILKDQRGLYGTTAQQAVASVGADCPALLRPDTLAAIRVVGHDLSRERLRTLYGMADCYVSAYRAEGFNLPVLEAIACGTPVIVTAGGATDDFCPDGVAWRIPGKPRVKEDAAGGPPGRYIEPDFDALVSAMDSLAAGTRLDPARFAAARSRVVEDFSWHRAARDLASLAAGGAAPTASQSPALPAAGSRLRANSFDVFDTLIARRCVEPWRIFEQVGERMGRPDFMPARIAAEAQLAAHDYTLDDIYRRLAVLSGMHAERAEALKAEEIALEVANVVPIRENLSKLRHGDLLVSDMYLPAAVIRRLLDAAGLDKKVGLVVSTHGKRLGHIWPAIASEVAIARHVGDNAVSDIAMPDRFGIATSHTNPGAPTLIETWLTQQGLPNLSRFAREARLRTWHDDPAMRGLQKIQSQLNIPILLLSSVQLLRVAAAVGAERLLFCSRDCDLWLALYRALPAGDVVKPHAEYFYSSRIALRAASPAYLDYARAMLGQHSMPVDTCGTGWSLSHLMQSLGMARRDVFFIHRCEPIEFYEEHAPTPDTCTIHSVIHPDKPILNIGIEMVNTAEHGSIVDVRQVAGTAIPVFGMPWESERVREAIAVQRTAFLDAVTVMPQHDLREVFALDAPRIATLVQALYEHLHAQPELSDVFIAEYRRETREIHQTLGIRLG